MEEKQGMTDGQYSDHLRAVIADLEQIKKLGVSEEAEAEIDSIIPGTERQSGKQKVKATTEKRPINTDLPAFRFAACSVILPKPSSPCRGYKRKPEKWLPFVLSVLGFPCSMQYPGNYSVHLEIIDSVSLSLIKRSINAQRKETIAMVAVIILALLIYGIFQFTKYLMGATVNHAQSHIAGSWGWQNLNPEPSDDLITFTKSVTAFVLALLLFSIFFS